MRDGRMSVVGKARTGPARWDVSGVTRACAPLTLLIAILAEGAFSQDRPVLLRPPTRTAQRVLENLRPLSTEPLSTRWDESTGRIRALTARIPLQLTGSIAETCQAFLAAVQPLVGGADDGVTLIATSEQQGIGTTHVRFQPFVEAVPLSSGEIVVHVDRSSANGTVDLIGVTSTLPFLGEPPQDLLQLVTPTLTAAEAIDAAVRNLAAAQRRPPRARLELHALPLPLRLTWAVTVWTSKPSGMFVLRIDAHSGALLSTTDRLRYGPGEARDGTGRVFLVNPVVALKNPSLEDNDDDASAVPDEAYADVALRGLDGSGGCAGEFVDTTSTPNAVRRVRLDFPFRRDHDGFEEVMIYYHIDSVQRFIQSLGFGDIANWPIAAFANSQPPGIPYEDPQAFFEPSFDTPGRGAMAFGSGGVDFAEDAEVIIHEYGHATQENQIPNFGATFESFETFAIGEGWSDFFAAAYLAEFSDGFGDLCLADWVSRGLEDFLDVPCIRRLDSEKEYPEALVGEPHADGEMWSASLWQIFTELGRNETLRLVFQSHFFLSNNASFRDAADAVIQADQALNAGSNAELLQRVFGRRGFLNSRLSLSWFHSVRFAPNVVITAGTTRTLKVLLDRTGNIQTAAHPSRPIQVYVDVVHNFPFGLEMTLQSPTGTRVQLQQSSFGASSPPFIFGADDASSRRLQSLAGEPIAGVWSLEISNGDFLDPATVSSWGLRFGGFIRGDADLDGTLSLNDAVRTLRHLFVSGPMQCQKAADVNDDGQLNVSDPIALLLFLFGGQEPPAAPYPSAGDDPTPDELTCDA